MDYNDNIKTESLRKIARQMQIANKLKLLRERYEMGDISKDDYVAMLRDLDAIC